MSHKRRTYASELPDKQWNYLVKILPEPIHLQKFIQLSFLTIEQVAYPIFI